MSRLPDPEEITKMRIEKLADEYTEGVCMACGKKVDYELYCMGLIGDGPMYCWECAGEPEF